MRYSRRSCLYPALGAAASIVTLLLWIVRRRSHPLKRDLQAAAAGSDHAVAASSITLSLVLAVLCYLYKRGSLLTEADVAAMVAGAEALNDALLQSFQGLLLTFHVAAQGVSDEQARKVFDQVQKAADHVMLEGVKSVEKSALRPSASSLTSGVFEPTAYKPAMSGKGARVLNQPRMPGYPSLSEVPRRERNP